MSNQFISQFPRGGMKTTPIVTGKPWGEGSVDSMSSVMYTAVSAVPAESFSLRDAQ